MKGLNGSAGAMRGTTSKKKKKGIRDEKQQRERDGVRQEGEEGGRDVTAWE